MATARRFYPVHAAVLYSDALSIQDLEQPIIDDVFRQGGISEEYVSFDAQTHKTSSTFLRREPCCRTRCSYKPWS